MRGAILHHLDSIGLPLAVERFTLARFLALYAALYAAFGVGSPFLPPLLRAHGLAPGAIGFALAADVAVRLLTAPAAGRPADRVAARRGMRVFCVAGPAVMGLGHSAAGDLG